MVTLIRASDRLLRMISSRRLQSQLLLIVFVAFAAAFVPLLGAGWQRGGAPLTPVDPAFALLWLVGAACAIGAATQAKFHRLAALIMVGGAGLVTCLTFAWFSAPDLALTQIAVEVVTTVLLLLGLRWMPQRLEFDELRRRTLQARARRARDVAVAVVAGAGVARLAYACSRARRVEVLSPFFVERSLAGGGRPQRRQRDPGRLPRLRYARRDHRGRHRGADGLRAAAPFRPAPESRAMPRAQREDAAREALEAGDGLAVRLPARPGDVRAHAAADGGPDLGLLPAARSQRAGRRLRRRPGDGHRASSCST